MRKGAPPSFRPPRHSGESRNPRRPKSTLRTPNSKLRPPRHSGERRNPRPPNPHFALPIPNSVPPALRDSASTPRRRSTTELAEARKGRGPRFSSGRRGSPPVIPAKAGIHVPPNPHFALPIPNSVPPALRDSASTPRRRSTTELAEARKGRGPRFSSGRRGSLPVIPAKALPRLPDENRGPRPFRASASSVVDRRLGVEALSLRAGGTEFGIGSAKCGFGGRGFRRSPE